MHRPQSWISFDRKRGGDASPARAARQAPPARYAWLGATALVAAACGSSGSGAPQVAGPGDASSADGARPASDAALDGSASGDAPNDARSTGDGGDSADAAGCPPVAPRPSGPEHTPQPCNIGATPCEYPSEPCPNIFVCTCTVGGGGPATCSFTEGATPGGSTMTCVDAGDAMP
jgi:hypothetical protein